MTVDVGRKFAGGRAAFLDAERFVGPAEKPEFADRINKALAAAKIELAPYATSRVISP